MRNSQKVLAALTTVMTLTGLAACGNANASNGNAGDADKAELVFWGWDTGHTMSDLIKDFQKANPGITVKFNNTGTASDTQTALSNAIAAGEGRTRRGHARGPDRHAIRGNRRFGGSEPIRCR